MLELDISADFFFILPIFQLTIFFILRNRIRTHIIDTQQNQLLRFMSSDLDYSATSPVKYNFNSRSRGSKLWRSVTFCYWLRTFTLVLAAPADLLIFIWSVIIFDKFINNFPHSYMGLRVPLSLSDTQFYLSPSTMTFFAIKQLKTI